MTLTCQHHALREVPGRDAAQPKPASKLQHVKTTDDLGIFQEPGRQEQGRAPDIPPDLFVFVVG